MSSSTDCQNHLIYSGWNLYSGTTTTKSAKWEYKSGKYEAESVFFFRNMKFTKGNKHSAVFVLLSLTPTPKQWEKMAQTIKKSKILLNVKD